MSCSFRSTFAGSLGKYVIIDLEYGRQAGFVPTERLRTWDERTLTHGKYTVASDIYLVSRLIDVVVSLCQTHHAVSENVRAISRELASATAAFSTCTNAAAALACVQSRFPGIA
eukprot:Opistho-2@76148